MIPAIARNNFSKFKWWCQSIWGCRVRQNTISFVWSSTWKKIESATYTSLVQTKSRNRLSEANLLFRVEAFICWLCFSIGI